MARMGEGATVIRKRAVYSAGDAYQSRAPRAVQTYTPPPGSGPTYGTKLSGQADRQYYSDAASEAGASTRLGAAARENMVPYHDTIRQSAIAGARAQDAEHFDIRRQLANDSERSYRAQMDDIRAWAQMAMTGDFRNAELAMRERAIDQDQAQFQGAREDRNYFQSLGLNQGQAQFEAGQQAREKELGMYRGERAIDRAQRGYEFETERQDRKKANRADRRRDRVVNTARAQDAADKDLVANRQKNKGVYSGLLGQMGYDTKTEFDEQVNPGQRAAFEDTAAYIAGLPDYRDATEAEIAQAAAETVGIQGRGNTGVASQKPADFARGASAEAQTGRGRAVDAPNGDGWVSGAPRLTANPPGIPPNAVRASNGRYYITNPDGSYVIVG